MAGATYSEPKASTQRAKAPPLSDKDKKRAEMWSAIIKCSRRERDALVKRGDRVLDHIIAEADTFERHGYDDESYDIQVLVPRLKAYLDPLAASVMAREPNVNVKPRLRENDDLEKTAELVRDVVSKANREQDVKGHIRMAIKEALIAPMSAVLTDYSKERGLPRVTWLPLRKCLWDTRGNGTIQSLRWTGMEFDLPIHVARKMYGEWLEPDSASLKAQYKKDDKFFDGYEKISYENFINQKCLVRIWYRGDNPDIDDANIADKDNKVEQQDDDDVTPRRNTVLVIDPSSGRILNEEPWPVTLDFDQPPIHFIVPEAFPNKLATIGTLEAYVHIQDVLSLLYSNAANTTLRTMKKVYLYHPEFISQDIEDALQSPENVVAVPSYKIEDLTRLDKYFKTLDLGSVTAGAFDGIRIFERLFDVSASTDDFTAQGISGIEKTGVARLAQGRVEERIAILADQIEDWMLRVLRSEMQIALSVMKPKDVALWVGADRLGSVDVVVEQDEMGNPVQRVELHQYWPEMDTAQIRRELDIEIEPGSMRKRSEEEMVSETIMLLDRTIGFAEVINRYLQPQGQQVSPQALLRVYNSTIIRIGELRQNVDTASHLFRDSDIIPLQPPPPQLQAPAQGVNPLEAALGGV